MITINFLYVFVFLCQTTRKINKHYCLFLLHFYGIEETKIHGRWRENINGSQPVIRDRSENVFYFSVMSLCVTMPWPRDNDGRDQDKNKQDVINCYDGAIKILLTDPNIILRTILHNGLVLHWYTYITIMAKSHFIYDHVTMPWLG